MNSIPKSDRREFLTKGALALAAATQSERAIARSPDGPFRIGCLNVQLLPFAGALGPAHDPRKEKRVGDDRYASRTAGKSTPRKRGVRGRCTSANR